MCENHKEHTWRMTWCSMFFTKTADTDRSSCKVLCSTECVRTCSMAVTMSQLSQSYLCVNVVNVLTCSGLILNHSCVTSCTVDSTCSSSGAEKPRTTTSRADSSAFWTDKRMYCVSKYTGLWKDKPPRCTESQQSWCIWHWRFLSPLYPLVPVCTPHSPSR